MRRQYDIGYGQQVRVDLGLAFVHIQPGGGDRAIAQSLRQGGVIDDAAARRQKWIDQAQSLNIYMAGASGKKLDDTYKLAWLRGLKTTYYLRTLGATSAEKSTGRGGELNAVNASGAGSTSGTFASAVSALPEPEILGAACTMKPGDPGFEECEACQ